MKLEKITYLIQSSDFKKRDRVFCNKMSGHGLLTITNIIDENGKALRIRAVSGDGTELTGPASAFEKCSSIA